MGPWVRVGGVQKCEEEGYGSRLGSQDWVRGEDCTKDVETGGAGGAQVRTKNYFLSVFLIIFFLF